MEPNSEVDKYSHINFLPKICGKFGYATQVSSWNREDLSRMSIVYIPHPMFSDGHQMEMVINDQDVWQILIGINKVEIIHATKSTSKYGFMVFGDENPLKDMKHCMSFETVFKGRIRTEQEFINIMDAVEAPIKL